MHTNYYEKRLALSLTQIGKIVTDCILLSQCKSVLSVNICVQFSNPCPCRGRSCTCPL